MSKTTRLLVTEGTLRGEILVVGQRAHFEAEIGEMGVRATFEPHSASEAPVDQWQLLRALDKFIEENLRG